LSEEAVALFICRHGRHRQVIERDSAHTWFASNDENKRLSRNPIIHQSKIAIRKLDTFCGKRVLRKVETRNLDVRNCDGELALSHLEQHVKVAKERVGWVDKGGRLVPLKVEVTNLSLSHDQSQKKGYQH